MVMDGHDDVQRSRPLWTRALPWVIVGYGLLSAMWIVCLEYLWTRPWAWVFTALPLSGVLLAVVVGLVHRSLRLGLVVLLAGAAVTVLVVGGYFWMTFEGWPAGAQ